MGDLLGNDTDYEMDKYYEAEETIASVGNPAIFKNKKSVFNTETLRHEILLPMSQGGYVQIGEEGGGKEIAPQSILIAGMEFGPDTPEFQRYYPAPQPEVIETAPDALAAPATELAPVEGAMSFAQERQASTGAMPTMEDFEAAGYASDVVEAAGLMGAQAAPSGRTEALTEDEVAKIVSEGGSLIGDYDPLLRESGSAAVTDFAVGAAVEGLRGDLEAKGADPRTIEEEIKAAMPRLRSEADVLSNALFGTGNPLGVGIGDFATAGVMDIQEGYRMYQQNFGPDGSLTGRAMGMTIMLAGLAEATGVGYAVGKLLKTGVKRLEGPLMRAAAQAEQRIAQEGSTMFSNPVGPIVDRGLAAAGRLAAPQTPDAAFYVAARVAEIKEKYPNVQLDIYGDAKKGFELGRIEIPETERSSGLGTAVMNDIIKMADDQGAVISLTPDKSFGGSSVSRLKKFYKQFGFVENKGKNKDFSTRNTMIRQPAVTAVDDGFVAKVEPPTDTKPGIIAFHGSAADFDGFKLEKIGTGEGAQAYGYGLYFSDSEDIAKFYKSAVRQGQDLGQGYEVTYKGKPFKNLGDTAEAEAAGQEYSSVSNIVDNLPKVITMETQNLPQQELLELSKNNLIKTRREQQSRYLEDMKESEFYDETLSPLMAESFDLEIKSIESIDLKSLSYSEGNTYQVGLDVNADELLAYDKSLEEQSPLVQQAVIKTLYEMTEDDAVNFGYETVVEAQFAILKSFTPKRFLNDWAAVRGSDDTAEKLLYENGVKGIRYKANRGSGDAPKEGPNNYVIFDDKLIQIMKKYGIVGPVSLASLTSQGGKEEGTANGI